MRTLVLNRGDAVAVGIVGVGSYSSPRMIVGFESTPRVDSKRAGCVVAETGTEGRRALRRALRSLIHDLRDSACSVIRAPSCWISCASRVMRAVILEGKTREGGRPPAFS